MTPTTARPYLLPPPYTLLLTYSRISPASPLPPPPHTTAMELRTVSYFYLRKTRVLPLTEILPTSSGRHFPRSRSSSAPLPHIQALPDSRPSPFGRGDSRTWDLIGGHFLGVLSGTFSVHMLPNKRKEDANMWDSFYFSFSIFQQFTNFFYNFFR